MRTHQTQEFTLNNGEEVELEFEYTPADWEEPVIKQAGNYIIFGYLSHDDDCGNPLDDCDGMGKIHHHPRSRYGRRDSDYFEVLGLDSYGDPIVDEDKVQDLWRERVMALPLRHFHIADKAVRARIRERWYQGRDYRAQLREALANEEAGDYNMWQMCRYGEWSKLDLPSDLISDLAETLDDLVHWDWDTIRRECAEPGDPDAVLLDLYDHSGVQWSVSGSGMQCRFDTSRGEAVWVPDQYARDEIMRRAPVYDYAWIEEKARFNESRIAYLLNYGDEKNGALVSDDWADLFKKAEEIAAECKARGEAPRFDGRRLAALELAEQALEKYNDWSNGDCYGVIVQVHELDGTLVKEDACWGYIGSDYAEETLKDAVESSVRRWSDRGLEADPNQLQPELGA